jgi:hypothetical protein
MLNAWDGVWGLHEDLCPCDIHFVEFLQDRGVTGASIFHFGTGSHHFVGIHAAENGMDNSVLAITCSRGEYESYIDLAIETPAVSRSYKAFFGDIYVLDERLLPSFDVVTLFHLCEFRDAANDAYGAMTDAELARMLIRKLSPGGLMLFYTGSLAFDAARPIIAELEGEGLLTAAGSFKTLLVFQKASGA